MPQRLLAESEFNSIRDQVLASLPDGLTEAEFHRAIGPRMEQALGTAENSPEPVEGSATSRFLSNAGEMLNPVAMAKGLYGAARHPIDTLEHIGAASMNQLSQAKQAAGEGRLVEAAGHVAGAIPIIGPAAVEAGEQIARGDVAGGLGKGAGMLVPVAAESALRAAGKAAGVVPKSSREIVAERLDKIAAERVSGVMRPTIGANKQRFGDMADAVAPTLVKKGDVGGWSREGLTDRVGAKLIDAEQALDAAADHRLSARTFPTQPIINDLIAKRAKLTAEPVEASHIVPSVMEGKAGQPVKVGRPLGQAVDLSQNADQLQMIDQAIAEIRHLGPVAKYEPLRRIRQSYDPAAKARYNPSLTQDFLKAQGGAKGAADVTGVLREHLAKFDPETAKANADYSLYRKADDVLKATAEIERVRPKIGRQIIARLTGATVGVQAAGAPGAVAGFIFGPAVEAAIGSGVTTKLQTAKLLHSLSDAVRKGDLGTVTILSTRLKRLGAQAATVQGRATSPSESPMPDTAPGLP